MKQISRLKMKKYLKTVTLLFFLIIVMFSIKVKALEFEPIDEFSINSTPIVELIVNLKLNKKDYSNYKISFFDKFDNSIKLLEKVDEDTFRLSDSYCVGCQPNIEGYFLIDDGKKVLASKDYSFVTKGLKHEVNISSVSLLIFTVLSTPKVLVQNFLHSNGMFGMLMVEILKILSIVVLLVIITLIVVGKKRKNK